MKTSLIIIINTKERKNTEDREDDDDKTILFVIPGNKKGNLALLKPEIEVVVFKNSWARIV